MQVSMVFAEIEELFPFVVEDRLHEEREDSLLEKGKGAFESVGCNRRASFPVWCERRLVPVPRLYRSFVFG